MEIQYLVQQPDKLETLSIKRVGDWIALQAGTWMHRAGDREELLSRHIENIRSTIEGNVPRLLHNQLFVEGIRALTELNNKPSADVSETCKENVISRMTESLFTKHLSVLDVNFDNSIFYNSLCHKSHLLVGLTELYLNLFKDNEIEVVQILTGLRNLKKLYITENFHLLHRPFSMDKIIACIVNNCNYLLEELDVKGVRIQINFALADNVRKMKNLKKIHLCVNTSISEKDIVNILKLCKNIEHVFTSNDNDTDTLITALEQIKSASAQEPKPELNLKIFQNTTPFTYEQLLLIVSTCPKLQRINIYKSSLLRGFSFSLTPLLDLQYLQELELLNYDFYGDQVKDILALRGQNLTVLCLEGVEPMGLNELMYIARTCSNLESLTLNKSTSSERTKPYNTTLLGAGSKAANPAFIELRELVFHDNFHDFSQSNGEELIFLLNNSPNIEIIHALVPITDDIMSTVLDFNPLLYLQTLQTCHSNLSRPVIERITRNCTNFPEITNIRGQS